MQNDKLEDFILNNKDRIDDAAPPVPLWDRIASALETDEEDDDPVSAFILKNREAFDTATPPPRVAGLVFDSLDATPAAAPPPAPPLRAVRGRKRWFFAAAVAASVLLVLSIGFAMGSSFGGTLNQAELVAAEIQRIDPEFAATEQFFRGEIATQMSKVRAVSDDPDLTADLETINQAAADIRATLLTVPEHERADLVGELIQLYQTKLDVLLRIQRHLPPAPGAASPTPQQPTNEL